MFASLLQRFAAESSRTFWLEILLHWLAFWCLSSWPAFHPTAGKFIVFVLVSASFLALRLLAWPRSLAGREGLVLCLVLATLTNPFWEGSPGLKLTAPLPTLVGAVLLGMRAVWDWRHPVEMYDKLATVALKHDPDGKEKKGKEKKGKEKAVELNWARVFESLTLVLVESPLLVFVISGLVVVLSPDHPWLWGLGGLLSAFVFVGSMHVQRTLFRGFRFLLERMFTQGFAQFVSMAVLVLATLRLFGLQYVTYILDESPGNAVTVSIVTAYAVAWVHDYWERRSHAEAIVRAIPRFDGMEVRPHADGCLLLGEESMPRWHFLNILKSRMKAEEYDDLDAVKDRANLRLLGSKLLFAAIASGAVMAWRQLEPAPAIVIASGGAGDPPPKPDRERLFDLSERIRDQEDRPLLLIAASGGGTRAALFTAAVLEGVDERGMLDRIGMLSGVSGGSLAIAAFAASPLRNKDWSARVGGLKRDETWEDLFTLMMVPYIDEVFANLDDHRLLCGYGLSHLLQESFGRELKEFRGEFKEECKADPTLSNVTDVGLVFNTTVCGIDAGREEAGGRLVLTNVAEFGSGRVPKVDMYYYAYGGDVSLSVAAAASANFPFVFGNVLLRAGCKEFHLTDGGVIDNHGMLSILIALRQALQEHSPEWKENEDRVPIRLLVIEASAPPGEYWRDRGLGVAAGGRAPVVSLAIQELLQECNRLYAPSGVMKAPGENSKKDPAELIQQFEIRLPEELAGFGTHFKTPPGWDAKEIVECMREHVRGSKDLDQAMSRTGRSSGED